MRVIRYAEIQCDDCGKAVRRMAPPPTPHSRMAEKRLVKKVTDLAVSRRWSAEGPSLMAGDLCGRCHSVADLAREYGS